MRILKQLGLNIVVVTFGSLVDYGAHLMSPLFSVPPPYLPNKLMVGSLIAVVAFYVGRRFIRTPDRLALFVCAVVAILLQVRYFLEGYNLFFVFSFLVLHFLMFLLPAHLLYRKFNTLL